MWGCESGAMTHREYPENTGQRQCVFHLYCEIRVITPVRTLIMTLG